MTAADWLASTDPDAMLAAVRDRAPDRKLLLFACGAARLIWDRLFTFGRTAVPLVEAAADMDGTDEDRRAAVWAACERVGLPLPAGLMEYLFGEGEPLTEAVRHVARALRTIETIPADREEDRWPRLLAAITLGHFATPREHAGQTALMRCVFGTPFAADPPPAPPRTVRDWFRRRPAPLALARPAFDPACRTAAALDLARAVYHDGEFGLLPILADALQDAGCADDAALAHCRGPGPHARGCWVVDAVLGKA